MSWIAKLAIEIIKEIFSYLVTVTTSSHTRNYITFFNPQGTPLRVVAFVAGLTDKTAQTQEERGVPSNKHYEIPFEKRYAVLFQSPEERHYE